MTSRFSARRGACAEQERTRERDIVKRECSNMKASLPRRKRGETGWIEGVAHTGSRGEQKGVEDDHDAREEEDGA
jgi:hypothetical protein